MAKFPMGKAIALYDLRGIDAKILYAGLTTNPSKRRADHMRNKNINQWFILHIVRWYHSENDAVIQEKKRIAHFNPPFNIQGRTNKSKAKRKKWNKHLARSMINFGCDIKVVAAVSGAHYATISNHFYRKIHARPFWTQQ